MKTISGLLIFRFDSNMFFANSNHFKEALQARIGAEKEKVKQVLVDAETINLVDSTATDVLLDLRTNFEKKGITLAFACIHDAVRNKMLQAGVVDAVGNDYFYDSLWEGVDAFERLNQENKK